MAAPLEAQAADRAGLMETFIALGPAGLPAPDGAAVWSLARDIGENDTVFPVLALARVTGPGALDPGFGDVAWRAVPQTGWVSPSASESLPEDHREIFVVFNNAVQGREGEYARWYDQVHLAHTFEHMGFEGAQRFALEPVGGQSPPYRYLTLYAVPEGGIARCEERRIAVGEERERAARAGREPEVPVSDALTGPRHANYFRKVPG
ncbi:MULTISPECIES: hypothetical protein [Nonomuraea]|uniref:Uncharacterized protein n=1 Tax=Nonomuraea ferruginea TaxID=46174 RepID=A0ABT4T9D8_9ACTN|nr:hypothetical protein [Nonomuraea ferruginea]MDA0646131.1 hypothetical protein [Nonomuraea ferruginea]